MFWVRSNIKYENLERGQKYQLREPNNSYGQTIIFDGDYDNSKRYKVEYLLKSGKVWSTNVFIYQNPYIYAYLKDDEIKLTLTTNTESPMQLVDKNEYMGSVAADAHRPGPLTYEDESSPVNVATPMRLRPKAGSPSGSAAMPDCLVRSGLAPAPEPAPHDDIKGVFVPESYFKINKRSILELKYAKKIRQQIILQEFAYFDDKTVDEFDDDDRHYDAHLPKVNNGFFTIHPNGRIIKLLCYKTSRDGNLLKLVEEPPRSSRHSPSPHLNGGKRQKRTRKHKKSKKSSRRLRK